MFLQNSDTKPPLLSLLLTLFTFTGLVFIWHKNPSWVSPGLTRVYAQEQSQISPTMGIYLPTVSREYLLRHGKQLYQPALGLTFPFSGQTPSHKPETALNRDSNSALAAGGQSAEYVENIEVQKERIAAAQSTPEPPKPVVQPLVPVALAAAPKSIDCHQLKCIALTFDDGPDSTLTPQILNDLAQKHAVATFFVIGSRLAQSGDMLKQILQEGSEVGDHTWNHRALVLLPDLQVKQEIDSTAQSIQSITGNLPQLFRPPYGAINQRVKNDSAYPVILWNIDTLDWKYPNPDTVFKNATSQTAPGDIILMHDIHPTTAQAVPRIIDTLQSEGYTLVTVGQILDIDGSNYQSLAGHTFFNRPN